MVTGADGAGRSLRRKPTRPLGDFGERIAANRLEAIGMKILARNIRVSSGEIDLLAGDGEDVVFVEVRTRRGARGLAAESIGEAKLRRMWQCAIEYCEQGQVDPARIRLDAIAVELDSGGRLVHVEHFRGLEVPD